MNILVIKTKNNIPNNDIYTLSLDNMLFFKIISYDQWDNNTHNYTKYYYLRFMFTDKTSEDIFISINYEDAIKLHDSIMNQIKTS